MFKYIKSKLMFVPCDVVKAYITALEKDPTRIDTIKWRKMKNDLWEHVSHRDRQWMHEQETIIRQKEMIVRIAVLELTNEAEPEDNSKAARINAGLSGMGTVNHSILSAVQQNSLTNAAPW